MNAHKLQHLIAATLIAILATYVCWISFTQEPASAFLFPRLISIIFTVLALINCLSIFLQTPPTRFDQAAKVLRHLLPGVLIVLVYIIFLAKFLGFYSAAFIAFLSIFSLYDPSSHKKLNVWVKRIAISASFMVVIYGLFNLILRVQVPRGIFL